MVSEFEIIFLFWPSIHIEKEKNIANFTLVLHWCSVFNTFVCSIFEFSTENIKKNGDKTVLKIWSQNMKKMLDLAIN